MLQDMQKKTKKKKKKKKEKKKEKKKKQEAIIVNNYKNNEKTYPPNKLISTISRLETAYRDCTSHVSPSHRALYPIRNHVSSHVQLAVRGSSRPESPVVS